MAFSVTLGASGACDYLYSPLLLSLNTPHSRPMTEGAVVSGYCKLFLKTFVYKMLIGKTSIPPQWWAKIKFFKDLT